MAIKKATFTFSLDIEMMEEIGTEWDELGYANLSHFVGTMIKNSPLRKENQNNGTGHPQASDPQLDERSEELS